MNLPTSFSRHQLARHITSRRTLLRQSAGAGLALAGTSIIGRESATANATGIISMQATPAPEVTPTVVFVHGAFADASSWGNVIDLLQAEGIAVLGVANPLRGIANDAAYLDLVLATIPGPVLLVGHSYGGAVISNISAGNTNVKGLVYVAAFALDEGETGFDILGQFPPTLLGTNLIPATADPDHPDLIINPMTYHEVFAADLPASVIPRLAATQRPVSVSSFAEPSVAPAWKRLPSWYAVATSDNAVGTEAERFFADRMGAITVEIEGSHVIMISQPQAVADLVKSALGSIG